MNLKVGAEAPCNKKDGGSIMSRQSSIRKLIRYTCDRPIYSHHSFTVYGYV